VGESFLYRGDGEGFLVNGEKKRGATGDLLKIIFGHLIPYMSIFWCWGGDREAAEFALRVCLVELWFSQKLL
jgi:hypothetical protein